MPLFIFKAYSMKIINSILAGLATLTLTGCASISTPEGGPRDTVPPTLVNSSPADQAVNVNTNNVRLQFDEAVQQVTLQKELMITPNTDNKYKIRFDDEVMELVFDKPLQDSTTFIFNFRNGIADITERNLVRGLRLSFSTGSYIDSSKVGGEVVNLMTQLPEKDVVVALYPANDTMNIRKTRPYYQSLTDANGKFNFENIKEDTYRIYALQDANSSNLYDNENERIGFLAKPITITADTQQVKIQTFKIDTKKPIPLQRQKFIDRFTLNYSEGVQSISTKATTGTDSINYKIQPDGRTVELFRSDKFTGGRVLVTAIDSAGNNTLDSVHVDFGQTYTQRLQGAQFKITNKTNTPQTFRPGQKATIEFQGQIKINGKTPITIVTDSATQQTLSYPEQVMLDKTKTELSFTVPALQARTTGYTIVIDSVQVQPVHPVKLNYPRLQLVVAEAQANGSVKGTVTTTAKSFILQLVDPQYNIVRELKNGRTFNFRDVGPGVYRFRILIDENNNGKWERGTADFNKEPEPVYIHPETVEIRANWELEDIKIQF